MIAKLITYGENRPQAIELMQRALRDYKIVGLNNNLRFLKRVFDHAIFQQGDYDTSFIEQNIDTLLSKATEVDSFDLVTAIVARNLNHAAKLNLPKSLLNYRNVRGHKDIQRVKVHDTSLSKDVEWSASVERTSESRGTVTLAGDKVYSYEIQSSSENQVVVVVNGQIRKQ